MSSGDAFRLDGKVALVTGGASGIGEATCRELARAGASVIVADINLEADHALAENLPNAKAARMDVTSVESIDAVAAQLDRLDILVNNAGIAHVEDIARVERDDLTDDDGECEVGLPGDARFFRYCSKFAPDWNIGSTGQATSNALHIARRRARRCRGTGGRVSEAARELYLSGTVQTPFVDGSDKYHAHEKEKIAPS